MKTSFTGLLPLLLAAAQPAAGQAIGFDKLDAVVWAQEQTLRGSSDRPQGLLRLGDRRIPFEAPAGTFSVPVRLGAGTTTILACTADGTACPDTLRLTLGYTPRPELELRASVTGRRVRLTGRVLDNPEGAALRFHWRADPRNPAPVTLARESDSTAGFTLPADAPDGEYYFDWRAVSGDTVRARTFVTAAGGAIRPFVMETDHAAWIEKAVLYQVTPYAFEANGNLAAVTKRIPEIAALGVNTLFLQPITRTHAGKQGYDVVDYFSIRPEFGTEADLRALVASAHAHGLRVLLDIVPNHTSIHHPYARHAIAHGDSSHYYDFYQRAADDAEYAMYYHTRDEGKMRFIHYFWKDLPNLNFDSPEVQRHITEAARYWIEEFDTDGYRIDAVWGSRARNPAYFKEWRRALKRVKPEVLLLGEDKATDPESFDFWDVAYDWYPEKSWVSNWTWQYVENHSDNRTFFRYEDESGRAALLRKSLTNDGRGWAPGARVLRFMENNDLFRFRWHHSAAQTKAAATLLLALPGVPHLYNGQEIGFRAYDHPYRTPEVFRRTGSIESQDVEGFHPLHRHLIRLRARMPALTSENFAEVAVSPAPVAGKVYAFRRWAGDQHVVAVVNLGAEEASPTLALPVSELGLDPRERYYLTDLVTGEAIPRSGAAVQVDVPGHTTRLFGVANRPVKTTDDR